MKLFRARDRHAPPATASDIALHDIAALIRLQLVLTIAIHEQLKEVKATMNQFDQAVADLAAQTQQNIDLESSIIGVITGYANQAHANSENPQAIRDLAAKMKASAERMANAITASTPAGEQTSTGQDNPTTGTSSSQQADTSAQNGAGASSSAPSAGTADTTTKGSAAA